MIVSYTYRYIMNMKNLTFCFSAIILTTLLSCDTYQGARGNSHDGDMNVMPKEPGKCYAKCLTPDIVEEDTLNFLIYVGDDPKIMDTYVTDEVIEIAPATSKWVKKKADRNCLSPDPNDCLVWCLVKKPAQSITIKNMLLDTTVTKDFAIETHNVDYIAVAGGQKVWMAVVCNPNGLQLKEIQNALNDQGYDLSREILQNNFGTASKKALAQFQKDNQLHIGGLTEESMEALGLEY